MSTESTAPDAEPRAQTGEVRFAEGDFHALSDPLDRDRQFDDARLATRRKLLALGKRFVKARAEEGPKLDCRTSIHHPRAFNGMRVRRLWTYLMRPKAEKTRLRRTIGADLAKDLDAAYRNAYLCLAIESDALEVSFRIHADAWFDGQNLLRRVKAEGLDSWLAQLNRLDGFQLRMHDWKGEWRCGQLEPEKLKEYLSYYTPGEHSLAVERRFPAPAGARDHAFSADAPELLLAELERLVPLYRFATWSQESDFLFAD
ncbi:hypothetical protein [Engelhardtia mirabilis]|uniref:Uncharacterized protein n=1 Tax=Engelhardtia mirabilis TaxID=2528011 RepID=A0A518BH41_9BACT|nr:hypothetical protein Pla133_13520 [Planctomycetes bacterium Pla133]QDV00611.1 hypothetical protein Pla86_13510 [Planctomycetes bacterium Pla86]